MKDKLRSENEKYMNKIMRLSSMYKFKDLSRKN